MCFGVEFGYLLKHVLEINNLFNMILYVRYNEETSCLKIVHFHQGDIPSEMEANAKSKLLLLCSVRIADSIVSQFSTRPFLKSQLAWCAHTISAPHITLMSNVWLVADAC